MVVSLLIWNFRSDQGSSIFPAARSILCRAEHLATQLHLRLNPKRGAAALSTGRPPQNAPAAPRLRFYAVGGVGPPQKGRDIMASFAVVRNINLSLISDIRNLVCPLCGASMMGFRCLGRCRSDWHHEWERALCAASKSEQPRSGKSCAKHRV